MKKKKELKKISKKALTKRPGYGMIVRHSRERARNGRRAGRPGSRGKPEENESEGP